METREEKDPRLEGALAFAKRGWPVFPVRENKLPAVKNWEQTATTDEAQIRDWFESISLEGCNFGFPPGKAGVFVVDTDVNKKIGETPVNGENSLREYLMDNDGYLPDTMTVKTPSGGLHRYYLADGFRSKNAFLPAVDIKTNGGYVVIPGSVTAKGRYEVTNAADPAELPEWFKASYNRRKSTAQKEEKKTLNLKASITPDTPDKIKAALSIIDSWPEAEEGERNDNLFRLMRELCKAGISRGKARDLYREQGIGVIGLDPDSHEVLATIKSAYGDQADFGEESKEARDAAIRLFDELPPEPDGKRDGYSDLGGFDWTTLAARTVPPRRWFIENWLSADPGYTVLFTGRGGTGKSSLILDLIHSLATGEPFCGMEVLRGSKAMYLSCEDSEEELTRRIHQRNLDHSRVPPGIIKVWPRSGRDNILCFADKNGMLKETKFMAELKKRGREFFRNDGGILILDTLSDIFFGNENDRSQVSQFVKRYLNRLGSDLGVTIIVLAHPAKAVSTTGQGFSGSTAWEGAFRCRWELNYAKADRIDGLLELVLAKSNTARAGGKVTLENRGGMFVVVDQAKVDDIVQEELVRKIDEAVQEGNPFGRGNQHARPVSKLKINDPVTGSPIPEQELVSMVSDLLAEGRIEVFRTKSARGLRAVTSGEMTVW